MNEQSKKISREAKIGILIAALAVIFFVTLLLVRNAMTVRRQPSTTTSSTTSISTTTPTTSKPGSSSSPGQIGEVIDEELVRPFRVEATIYRYYFEENIDDELLAHVKQPDNSYAPSEGVDYVYQGQAFPVYAAFTGRIFNIENDALEGTIIQVISADNLVASYHSIVAKTTLTVDSVVNQGDLLGTAGTSILRQDSGVHLHFALSRDERTFNPENNYGNPITAIS